MRLKSPFSAPFSVTFIITNNCNLRCKHCFTEAGATNEKELDTKEIKRVIDELAKAKVFSVVISGGEPFIRPDFFEILDYFSKYYFRLGINTNATLITAEIAKKLKSYPSLKERILIGFDGASEETYSMLRGKVIFEKMIAGVENLKKFNLPVAGFFVVNRYNYKEIPKAVELAKKLGFRYFDLNPYTAAGRGGCFWNQFSLKPEQKKEAIEISVEIGEKYKGYVTGSFLRWANTYKRLENMDWNQIKNTSVRTLQPCGTGTTLCAIRPDGQVIPCHGWTNLPAGDILKLGLKKIWLESEVFQKLRALHDVSLDEVPKCKDCKYKVACNGGCRASAYACTNELISYDPVACYQLDDEFVMA